MLLPFERSAERTKFYDFWHTIFPGSTRLITPDGHWYGDNTDVRPPAEDELWNGSFFSVGLGSITGGREALKLTLDGVFFVDGGFAGPNLIGMWEHTGFASEAYLMCANSARDSSMSHEDFFNRVQEFTGRISDPDLPPRPDPLDLEAIRKYERQIVGQRVHHLRKALGDEAAVARIAAFGDAPVPKLYKL